MDSCSQFNKSYYERLSPDSFHKHRDTIFESHQLLRLSSSIARHLKKRSNDVRWLDIGCGQGKAAEVARSLGVKYRGLDIAQNNILECASRYPEFSFQEGDFLEQEFEEKFEVITFLSSLHHISDWKAAIKKAEALLAAGGFIYIDQEPCRWFAQLYGFYLRIFSSEYEQLKSVEKHWLGSSSILPDELPSGATEYHFDYIPGLRLLDLRTRISFLGMFFPHYRKWIHLDCRLSL